MIKKEFLIEKRNILNEIRANNMTLQELRFFSIYLSKINPRDINTRVVRFPMTDFQKIMEFGRLNIKQLSTTTDSLLCKIVKIPNANGGFTKFQLFKECTVDIDKNGEWYIEINAHDKALPLMFDFKNKYFTYQLWNALMLKSSNQLRMYEILKQYETAGERIISVDDLKSLLGIALNEYARFGDFKVRVLDSCQQALELNTDIRFTYESTGKRGKGGKILALKFTIKKNTNYVDQLTLEEFIDTKSHLHEEIEKKQVIDMEFFSNALDNEFTILQVELLYKIAQPLIKYNNIPDFNLKMYDYLNLKYRELNVKKDIKHRFGYLKKLIELDSNS